MYSLVTGPGSWLLFSACCCWVLITTLNCLNQWQNILAVSMMVHTVYYSDILSCTVQLGLIASFIVSCTIHCCMSISEDFVGFYCRRRLTYDTRFFRRWASGYSVAQPLQIKHSHTKLVMYRMFVSYDSSCELFTAFDISYHMSFYSFILFLSLILFLS